MELESFYVAMQKKKISKQTAYRIRENLHQLCFRQETNIHNLQLTTEPQH